VSAQGLDRNNKPSFSYSTLGKTLEPNKRRSTKRSFWKGGVLVGQSSERLKFFKRVVDTAPAGSTVLSERNTWGIDGEYYLTYLWDRQHATQSYRLLDDGQFKADVIDTLAMTITPVAGTLSGTVEIALPIKPYLAIRVVRA
jgi:Domain of unknown function (DUF5605)